MELPELLEIVDRQARLYEKVLAKLDSDGLAALGLDPKLVTETKFQAQDGALRFDGTIWPWTVYRVREYLAGATGPIEVRLSSPGGDAAACMAIYYMLRNYKGKVTTYADGQVSSAAAMIYLSGDERLWPDEGSSTWMMHGISTLFFVAVYGNRARLGKEEPGKDLEKLLKQMERLDTAAKETIGKRTEMGSKEIDKALDDERYFTGAEALKAGIATAMYSPPGAEEAVAEAPALQEFTGYAATTALRRAGILAF